MGLGEWLARLFGPGKGHKVDELARRLGVPEFELRAAKPQYREFAIPKRSGRRRTICAPEHDLKLVQRDIHRRLLKRLKCHRAATAFQHGSSIVANALPHVGKAVVVNMDLRDFFGSTSAGRVRRYFRRIGWNREAAGLLAKLCTHKGGLPQGAPTSPLLSNLINTRMDARLAGLARRCGATYTRYADDITFSFERDDREAIRCVLRMTKKIVGDFGYGLHQRRKLHIRRPHEQQRVTGLVVNEKANLPREVRRRLRAVEHRLANGREATLTPEQLAGWKALQEMIARQRVHGTMH